jgi:hypothetical protein
MIFMRMYVSRCIQNTLFLDLYDLISIIIDVMCSFLNIVFLFLFFCSNFCVFWWLKVEFNHSVHSISSRPRNRYGLGRFVSYDISSFHSVHNCILITFFFPVHSTSITSTTSTTSTTSITSISSSPSLYRLLNLCNLICFLFSFKISTVFLWLNIEAHFQRWQTL